MPRRLRGVLMSLSTAGALVSSSSPVSANEYLVVETRPPVISSALISPSTFAVARRPTAISARRARVRRGTRIRLTLSELATVHIALVQKLPGQIAQSGHRHVCVTPRRARRHARACTRRVRRGTLTRIGQRTGAHSISFSGRIGSKALRPGRYEALITATDPSGNASRPVALPFRIVAG